MQVSVTRNIAAHRDALFGILCDVAAWPSWNPNFKTAVPLAPGPIGLGYKAKIKPADGPEATVEVVTFEPGRQIVWKSSVMGMTVSLMHQIGDAAGGASPPPTAPIAVTFETRLEGGLGSLMGGFMKGKLEKALNEGIDGLKRFAERTD